MSFTARTSIEDKSNKTYKMCYADFDTPIFQAANGTQTDKIKVTHKRSGNVKIFKGVKDFRGLINKKTGKFGGWLKGENEKWAKAGHQTFTPDDFTITPVAILNEPDDPNNTLIEEAVSYFDYSVGILKKHMDSDDYRLIVGIGDNPRYDWANLIPYKGERKEKPILFNEVKDAIIEKYKNKIIFATDKEGDDEVSRLGWDNYQNYLKTGVWENCISYIDKDLDMIPSPSFNYNNTEEGFIIRDLDDGMRCFAVQLLSGDLGTDNIQGLPNLSEWFCENYGLKRSSGLGKTTAQKIVNSCVTMKEVFERVCEAYIGFYGGGLVKFESFRGDDMEMTWLDILNENAKLLWMYRDAYMEYDIRQTLDHYEVLYGNNTPQD